MESNNPFIDKTGEFGEKELQRPAASSSFMAGADVQGELAAAVAAAEVAPKPKPEPRKWVGSNQKVADAAAESITPEAEARTNEQRISELETILVQLRLGTGGVKLVTPKPEAQLDWTKLSEKDVFDLTIPIQAVEHQVPDLTKIELKDKNYIARYINLHPGRLGPMRAAGFTFITKEDIESIAMDITPDENGQYRYIDTVAMKCPKIKYLGALRANYERAVAVTDKNVLHRIMKSKTAEMLGSAELSGDQKDNPDYGKSFKRDAQKYQAENKLEVYL